jgi:hypothetical protein
MAGTIIPATVVASSDRTAAHLDPAEVEAVSLDPLQHGVAAAIKPGDQIVLMERALVDRHPWPGLAGEVGASPLCREAGKVASRLR